MLILKVVSALLSYPQQALLEALDEIASEVNVNTELPEPQKTGLLAFINTYHGMELLEWQQRYVELFDRGRSLSLLIFEHVHGESRDRGQAMVDLLGVYQNHGFEITTRELPDHIPLFLEFLSQIPKSEALDLLHGALPVLRLLGARLAERESPYSALFDALSAIAGETSELETLRHQVVAEGLDDTLLRMDEIWEEEVVSFMGNPNACDNKASQPLKYTPRPIEKV